MAVAKLLEKRQSDIMSGESDAGDEKDSVSSANGAPTGVPVFQPLLMKFLDNDAPILGKLLMTKTLMNHAFLIDKDLCECRNISIFHVLFYLCLI
jgi:Eukaryotic Mediator 12 subunit domain.